MAAPDINFDKIRLHRNTKEDAFEELCCQLARDFADGEANHFVRKGLGADGGVEAFAIEVSGGEIGWQVKYYWKIGELLTALSKSLSMALSKHPKLTKFIACFPFDLADSRKPDVTTALEKWTKWEKAELAKANALGRSITIECWDASKLKELLLKNSAAAGRIAFWFDAVLFDQSWFEKRFRRSEAGLGSRYTAQSSLNLPIRKAISATTGDPAFGDELRVFRERLLDAASRLPSPTTLVAKTACMAVDAASAKLGTAADLERENLPVAELEIAVSAALSALEFWRDELRNAGHHNGEEARQVSSTVSLVAKIDRNLKTDRWRLVNERRLLVYGEGGRGKSHLLADACKHQIDRGFPAILILSNMLRNAEPWLQIISSLDLPKHMGRDETLSALNTAAEGAGVRAMLVIDGLNERDGQALWSSHLSTFLADVESYPWISVIVSCRSTYLENTIPDTLGEDELPRLEHQGFSVADATHYLSMRGISSLAAPWPLEEFQTPLFLKTLCDGLLLNGETALPKGASGLTTIFDLYAKAVIGKITGDMNLNGKLKHVGRAIAGLATEIAGSGKAAIDYIRADEIVSSILVHDGTQERDMLFQLISSGMLSVDRVGDDEEVRFTFERYGDYIIAVGVLEESLGEGMDVAKACKGPSPLADMLDNYDWRCQGVLEVLALLLPEKYGVELPDVATAGAVSPWIRDAFENGLPTRKQEALTARTWALIDEYGGDLLTFETLIRISTDPDSPYNANALHARLSQQRMPERDASWSVHLASHNTNSEHLIDWALEADMSQTASDRAELAAICIAWFCSTSDRRIRDRATKALVVLLSYHPAIVEPLLARFVDIDDTYVLERILCAIYGAAMQGRWKPGNASKVVVAVNASIFAAGTPPVNILVRDHSRNLILWASNHGHLPAGFDLTPSQMPYASSWPIEFVSDATIAGFKETYPTGFVSSSRIVGSCVEDGDFARYVLDYAVGHFSPAARGTNPLPTRKALHERWEKDFLEIATPLEANAYAELKSATAALPSQGWPSHEDRKSFNKVKEKFQAATSMDMFERWRAEAENWRSEGMYQQLASRDYADFNLAWARRWVAWRAHDLGWSEVLHKDFDASVRNERMSHGVERIGKKYQWLALYELIARMADNLEPIPKSNPQGPEGLRNIDPSLILGSDPELEDGDAEFDGSPVRPRSGISIVLPAIEVDEAITWRDVTDDLPDTVEDIELIHDDGSDWLLLKGFNTWRGGPETLKRELSRWVTCAVVTNRSRNVFLSLVEGESEFDHDSLNRGERLVSDSHLGEYPWRWSNNATFDGWMNDWHPRFDSKAGKKCRVRATTIGFLAESGGYDYSINNNIDVHLPEPWLIQELGLHLIDGKAIGYANVLGHLVYQDGSATEGAATPAMIRRKDFLEMLKRKKLSAVWLIGGERNIYGKSHGEAFGGRLAYSSVLWSNGGALQLGKRSSKLYKPSRKQLKALSREHP